jgi:VanZ family protein
VTRFVALWGPALAVMAVIFVASGLPNLQRLPGDVDDHVAHFAGYALLSALFVRALAGARWAGVTWRTAALAWVLSVIYGASDEWHQRFVPGRFAAVDDWVADALGAAAAAVTLLTMAKAIGRRREGREV